MHARLRGPNNLLILHQINIEPDFPCLADEIAEPRPAMNIKVVAFTHISFFAPIYICLILPGLLAHILHATTSNTTFS